MKRKIQTVKFYCKAGAPNKAHTFSGCSLCVIFENRQSIDTFNTLAASQIAKWHLAHLEQVEHFQIPYTLQNVATKH